MTHLTFSVLVAALLSVALGLIGARSTRERLYVAAYTFLSCTAATVAGSWAMYLIHG